MVVDNDCVSITTIIDSEVIGTHSVDIVVLHVLAMIDIRPINGA